MTDQLGDEQRGDRHSEPEVIFQWRWRQLIDEAGGQSRVAARLNWATSTASRDYNSETLPTGRRLAQLGCFRNLPEKQVRELEELLQAAHAARRARLKAKAAPTPPAVPAAGPPGQDGARLAVSPRRRERIRARGRAWAAAVAVVVSVGVAVTVWSWPGQAGPRPAARPQPGPTLSGSPYPGLKLTAVVIPLASLQAPLRAIFSRSAPGGTAAVTGYVFRNSSDFGLCLGAMTTGAKAGKNGDPVRVWNCDAAPSQIWIPEQWELHGARFTWLVNDQYQSKCLNADNIGGLADNHKVQLWNCYVSNNEEWDFGDWYRNVRAGVGSYPIFVQSGNLCLDADKFDLRDGTMVHLWTQYPTANQFWS